MDRRPRGASPRLPPSLSPHRALTLTLVLVSSQSLPYDAVDFDESLDPSLSHSLSEDRWFEDEPEDSSAAAADGDQPMSTLAEGEYDY